MCKAMHVMSMHRYSYKQKYTLQAKPPQFLPNLLHCIFALHCKEVSTQLQCRWNCHWRQYLQWPRPTWVSLAHQDLYCQSLTWHQVSTQGLLEKDLSSQDSTARLYLAGLMSSQNNATSAVHWPPFAPWCSPVRVLPSEGHTAKCLKSRELPQKSSLLIEFSISSCHLIRHCSCLFT